MKKLIKKILPKRVILGYHRALSLIAPLVYGFPTKKIRVIGITGTTGKTTTANYLHAILNGAGHKTALATTANFCLGERCWLNAFKMTMLGRFKLQKFLQQAIKEKCRYAIVEVTSEGIVQYRHKGIDFKIGVFTNLFPEHLESHGGFENYKRAKLSFMADVLEAIFVNGNDQYAKEFLNFPVEKKITFGKKDGSNYQVSGIHSTIEGIDFKINGIDFHLNILGDHHADNAAAAAAVAAEEGVSLARSAAVLGKFVLGLGRMEFVNVSQPFKVVVDYAFEPNALTKAFATLRPLVAGDIITVLGSTGGGRDKKIMPVKGQITARNSSLVIITNEDPYDDDPEEIINRVAEGALREGKILNKNCFKILDRGQAIRAAIKHAKPQDLVLITGKACEQFIMAANGQKIPWDDREEARRAIRELKNYKISKISQSKAE